MSLRPWEYSKGRVATVTTWQEANAEPENPVEAEQPAEAVGEEVPAPPAAGEDPWPAAVPAEQLGDLHSRLSNLSGSVDAEALDRLGREAAELRAAVVRMSGEKLQRAEAEAAEIRREAAQEAARTRREAAQAMVSRLEEASAAADSLRQAAMTEIGHLWGRTDGILDGILAQVRDLRTDLESWRSRAGEISEALQGAENQLGEALRFAKPDQAAETPDPGGF